MQVQSMHLLTTNIGWVAGKTNLLRTQDGGRHWGDITPSANAARSIQSVFFLDGQRGWVISSSTKTADNGSGSLFISNTSNGGQSWTSRKLAVSDEDGGTAVSVDFVDAQHGWIMFRMPSSSNFSLGLLLATADGGATWNPLPEPPSGDVVHFTSPSTGWLTAGAAHDQLYVTRDGGNHWQKQLLSSDLAQESAGSRTYQLPVFSSNKDGALAVFSNETGGSQLEVYSTHDNGVTWAVTKTMPLGDGVSRDVVSVVNADTLLVAPANREGLTAVAQGVQRTHQQIFSKLSSNQAVTNLDFKDDHQGWVLVSGGSCANWKSQCSQESHLFTTSDGGQTTTEITPQVTASAEGSFSTVTPDTVVNTTTKGFDQCAAGSVSQMQAWWTNTPWSYANIYMGGSNRGCSQANLTSGWINSILAQGWKLVPTWVGPQAPTSSCSSCGKMSSTASTAAQQGINEANAAANAASALGLNSPTVIYYDMEQYNGSSAAVQAFVNGWVQRLHQLGDKAGVYGSGSNAAADWAPIANPPDAVWIANWNGNTSVFGLSGLSDNLWTTHQRLHQYQGGHNETWGGVTFNIDSDSADGPIASR